CEVENAALVDVARGRTHRIRNRSRRRVERARTGAQELRWIQFERVLDMGDVRTHIRSGYEQIRCDLPLNSKIPRILRGRLHILRYRKVCAVRSKYGIVLVKIERERVAARIVPPRIVKRNGSINNRQTERRNGRRVLVDILPDEVMRDSGTNSNCCLSFTRRIPCQAE